MADRMSTRIRYDRIRDKSAESRTYNGHLKRKERATRDARIKKLILDGKYPYIPAVQSWLCDQLGLKFSQIDEAKAREHASK